MPPAQKHYGPHNAEALLDAILASMAACGEIAQGIMRHRHWSGVAAGEGLIGVNGDPNLALVQAQQAQAQAQQEVQLAVRQVRQGVMSKIDSDRVVDAVLDRAPGTPPASIPPPPAAGVASAAGQATTPKLTLA